MFPTSRVTRESAKTLARVSSRAASSTMGSANFVGIIANLDGSSLLSSTAVSSSLLQTSTAFGSSSTSLLHQQQRGFARQSSSGGGRRSGGSAGGPPPPAGSPPPPANTDPWQEVKDPNGSNQTYWWNPTTNEVTPLGAPKPQTLQGQQQTGMMQQPAGRGGIMGAIADGMAWGVGTSMASRAMDSILGPRTMEVVHTNQDGSSGDGSSAGSPPPADSTSGTGGESSFWGDSNANSNSDAGGGGWFGNDGTDSTSDGGWDGGAGGGWFDE